MKDISKVLLHKNIFFTFIATKYLDVNGAICLVLRTGF